MRNVLTKQLLQCAYEAIVTMRKEQLRGYILKRSPSIEFNRVVKLVLLNLFLALLSLSNLNTKLAYFLLQHVKTMYLHGMEKVCKLRLFQF